MEHITEGLRPLAVQVATLSPDVANARRHSQRNIDAIKASLQRFGQVQPLVVQEEGLIVRIGNGRLQAMKDLGWDTCAALVVPLEKVEAVALAIADNRTAELAEWDDDALRELLNSLDMEGFDVTEIGFDSVDFGESEINMEETMAGSDGFADGSQFADGGLKIIAPITEQQSNDEEFKAAIGDAFTGLGVTEWRIGKS